MPSTGGLNLRPLDPESDGLPIDIADNNIFRLAYLTDCSGIVSVFGQFFKRRLTLWMDHF